MSYTAINNFTDYFNTKLYEGNGSSPRSITGVGFQPDWTWTKNRDNTNGHGLFDAVRGYATGKGLSTHNTSAEGNADSYGYLSSRDSDGYTMTAGGSGMTMNNTNGESYVSWNWKANGSGSSNTDVSITSTVSANTTSGFSIVSWTGNGTGNSTIGHGLGATPKFIIVKNLTTTQDWGTFSPSFSSASNPNILYLSKTSAQADDSNVWGTSATFNNNTFTVGDWNGSNQSGSSFIAYCFAEKIGYSRFGSYVGNGNVNGSFVYTGFKPVFFMTKRADATAGWQMYDGIRDVDNPADHRLQAQSNAVELVGDANTDIDFLSNGFKLKNGDADSNAAGGTYIYMAFGQTLVGSNNIPCTAR